MWQFFCHIRWFPYYFLFTFDSFILTLYNFNMFCSDNLSFQYTTPSTWLTNWCTDPSTWLTTNLIKMLAAKVLQFINTMKITKLICYKTLLCTNPVAFSRERWTRAYVSSHNMHVKNLCIKLHSLASTVTALKIILIYV